MSRVHSEARRRDDGAGRIDDGGGTGIAASESPVEREDILKILQVFKANLLAEIRAGDVAGILAPTYLYRDGKRLGGGLVLTLGDRAVIGWMRGIFKRPTTEIVPLTAIDAVQRATKVVGGKAEPMPAILVTAGDDWEMLQSPDVPAQAPLYELLSRLLDGSLHADELPIDDLGAAS